MSDKGKKPLYEIVFQVDIGSLLAIKTCRIRAKSECNAHFEFGKFAEKTKLNNAEILSVKCLAPVKKQKETTPEKPAEESAGKAGAEKTD